MISNILCRIISREVSEGDVAVLLSGGADSTSLAFSAHRLGKRVTGYTFHIADNPSYDSLKAQDTCAKMGWPCVVTEVPIDNIHDDFIYLANTLKCTKKTHFECTWPFMYIYPKIKQDTILSGVAADGHYGVSKKACIHYKQPKERFDLFRKEYFAASNPAGVVQQRILSDIHNRKFVAPYLDMSVLDYFRNMDWFELNKPFQKHHVIKDFPEFDIIGGVKKHINLQLGSGIDKIFEQKILTDKILNARGRSRVMDVCRDFTNEKT